MNSSQKICGKQPHPDKFSKIMMKAIPGYQSKKVNLKGYSKINMTKNYRPEFDYYSEIQIFIKD